jgi:hypothetical protein
MRNAPLFHIILERLAMTSSLWQRSHEPRRNDRIHGGARRVARDIPFQPHAEHSRRQVTAGHHLVLDVMEAGDAK